MRRFLVIVAGLALAVPSAGAGAGAQEGRTVTLAAALDLARAHQPDVRVAQGAALSARAAAERARAPRLPTLDASASYGVGAGNPGDVGRPRHSTRLGLDAGWLLWDFGETSASIAAADASAGAADADATQAQLDLALSVRSTYFATRAAKELVGVKRDTLTNQEHHLQQTEAFVEVGRRPEIDRYQVRTQVANARLELIQAENAYEVAKGQLARAIGDPGAADFDVADETMPAVEGEDGSDATLYAEAVRARPDLAALERSRQAQAAQLDAAHAAFMPALSASAGVEAVPLRTDADAAWGWSAGLQLTWRIFDGGVRRANIHSAEASVMVADARREALAQNVRVELRQARLAVRAAKAARAAAQEASASATKQLELAEGRYTEGVGNAIELGDAQVEVARASAQTVQSEYDLATARAQLLHALGR